MRRKNATRSPIGLRLNLLRKRIEGSPFFVSKQTKLDCVLDESGSNES